MTKKLYLTIKIITIFTSNALFAKEDTRELVKFPEMMQHHMLSNMRDHLQSLNEILENMSNDNMNKAADIAEYRLGMSSLTLHGASHIKKFMPEGMAKIGTNMHKAASHFALKVEEGDLPAALKSLSKVTASCIACHSGYRIR